VIKDLDPAVGSGGARLLVANLCSKCQQPLGTDARFCAACGTALTHDKTTNEV